MDAKPISDIISKIDIKKPKKGEWVKEYEFDENGTMILRLEDTIYRRLFAAMHLISYVQKDKQNPALKYNYVSHDSVTAKIRETFLKVGIMPITSVVHHERVGNNTFVKIEIKLVNINDHQDYIVITGVGEGNDSQDKGIGKAISYAVKYAYLKLLCLETGDDPEQDNIETELESNNEKSEIISQIMDMVDNYNLNSKLVDYLEKKSYGSIKTLPLKELKALRDKIRSSIK